MQNYLSLNGFSLSVAGKNRQRFTLIELLIVIVVIAILIAMLLPGLMRARRQANVAVCINNLREINQGFTIFASDHDAWYPRAVKLVGKRKSNNTGEILTVGLGTSLRHKPGPVGYTYVPVLQPYFGGTMNTVFRCPLAIPQMQEGGVWGDFDKPPHVGGHAGVIRVPYRVYTGVFTGYSIGRNPYGPDFMRKVGDTFRLPSLAYNNDADGAECFVFAADVAAKGAGKSHNRFKLVSSHEPVDGTGDSRTGYSFGDPAWSSYDYIDANFTAIDGSARHYPMIRSREFANGSKNFYHNSRGKSHGGIIPKEMCH